MLTWMGLAKRFRFHAAGLFVLIINLNNAHNASAFSSLGQASVVAAVSQCHLTKKNSLGSLQERVSFCDSNDDNGDIHGVECKHQEALFCSNDNMQPRRLAERPYQRQLQRQQLGYISRREMMTFLSIGFSSLVWRFDVDSVQAEETVPDPLEAFGRSLQEGQIKGQSGAANPPTWGSNAAAGVKGALPSEKGDRWPATASPVPTFENTGSYTSPPNLGDAIRESKRIRAVGPLTHG
uniref:Uncharacterized protein n=1 Tax=Leptocylindrus danicus TaxID=163516 RepID=A0A6U2SUM8_9STRA|mmetsp:Transcript_739/g.1031  ORF Transcript_739/g.1031 Transcript_739/m.1031 type:complete len:237 (+) Transcript_739:68-778(+)